MQKLVDVLTTFNRPLRLRAWYRRHPKTTLAMVVGEVVGFGLYLHYRENN